MEIGLVLPHSGPNASPSFIRDFAQTAEGCGVARLWGVDHVVLPRHTDSLYPLGRQPTPVADNWLSDNLAPNFELVTTLSWVAGLTTTIGLGSSVAVLPLRNPILNARQLASLDAFSQGRLMYGIGVGWLREEATAMAMPWNRRAARSEEHIAVLRTLWCSTDSHVEFHGQYYDFAPMDPRPQPTQRPIPILVGGHSPAALDRAARLRGRLDLGADVYEAIGRTPHCAATISGNARSSADEPVHGCVDDLLGHPVVHRVICHLPPPRHRSSASSGSRRRTPPRGRSPA